MVKINGSQRKTIKVWDLKRRMRQKNEDPQGSPNTFSSVVPPCYCQLIWYLIILLCRP